MRMLYEIAKDIQKDWVKVSIHAQPYLSAMRECSVPSDKYIHDDASSIVLYFLSNASTYRGENAKKYKLELKAICGFK